jgi:hypothetical protein
METIATTTYTRSTPHHYFDYQMWQSDVAGNCTERSYNEWVQALLSQTREELQKAEAAFDAAGGRGIELADEIDELRRKLEEDEDDSPEMDALLNHEGRTLGWEGMGGGMRFFM